MGLPALPPAVTAMSRLEYLECSMNVPSITLPAGPYLASLTLLAADWETLAGSTAALSSLHKREWGGVGLACCRGMRAARAGMLCRAHDGATTCGNQ